MYRVPPDRAWWPAVGAPLERRVRQRCVDRPLELGATRHGYSRSRATSATRSALTAGADRVLKPSPARMLERRDQGLTEAGPDELTFFRRWPSASWLRVAADWPSLCGSRSKNLAADTATAPGDLQYSRRSCGALRRSRVGASVRAESSGEAASWLFSSRRKALTLLECCTADLALPNVRVKPAPTAWRAGQQAHNGP